jgi:hypothetical protein
MKKNYVIVQKPNLVLKVWFVSFILSKLFSEYSLFDVVAFGSIFTWAWLEIFDGVNNFRKGLGIVVMIIVLGSRVF